MLKLPIELVYYITDYLYDLDIWYLKITCKYLSRIPCKLDLKKSVFSIENLRSLKQISRKYQKQIFYNIFAQEEFIQLQFTLFNWKIPKNSILYCTRNNKINTCRYLITLPEFNRISMGIEYLLSKKIRYFANCLNIVGDILPVYLAKIYAYIVYYYNEIEFLEIILQYEVISNELICFAVEKQDFKILTYISENYPEYQKYINLHSTRNKILYLHFYKPQIDSFYNRKIAINIIKYQGVWGLKLVPNILRTDEPKTLFIIVLCSGNISVLNYMKKKFEHILSFWFKPYKLHHICAEYDIPNSSEWLLQNNINVRIESVYIAIQKNSPKFVKWYIKNYNYLIDWHILYKYAQDEERKAYRRIPREKYKIRKILQNAFKRK